MRDGLEHSVRMHPPVRLEPSRRHLPMGVGPDLVAHLRTTCCKADYDAATQVLGNHDHDHRLAQARMRSPRLEQAGRTWPRRSRPCWSATSRSRRRAEGRAGAPRVVRSRRCRRSTAALRSQTRKALLTSAAAATMTIWRRWSSAPVSRAFLANGRSRVQGRGSRVQITKMYI
jgi:hypothetical protein